VRIVGINRYCSLVFAGVIVVICIKIMMQCFKQLQHQLKGTTFESRMDSAFFSQTVLTIIGANHVKFTASVPFERFPELKAKI
jgi:hypothetical protein